MHNHLALLLTASLITATASADLAIPRVSPGASVSQKVGTTEVRVDYHRPAVKGRPIWGSLVPYGEVWRLGANDATKITASDPFTVGETTLPAGSYALFAIPTASTWTFVLNSQAEQWGAFARDATKDVARVEVLLRPAPFTEWLSVSMTPVGTDAVDIEVRWAHVAATLQVKVAVASLVWSQIDVALAATPDDAKVLGQAARFAADSGERLEQGLAYIDRAQAASPGYRNLEVRAKLLWALGREAEARQTMEKALLEAKEKSAPEEFSRTRGAILAGWKLRGNAP